LDPVWSGFTGKLLAPAEQQEWASRFVPDFFDMAHSSGQVPVDE
jgi:hypothetical protein